MYFKREIESELIKQIDKREITVLTGMRRTGKTTLLKRLFDLVDSENKIFFDLQNIIERKVFEELDYNNIVNNFRAMQVNAEEKLFVFIDEIQFMPQVVNPIKYLYDHYNIKFFVTGSSSFYLKNLFPESLAGRKIVFELFPLSFKEFLRFKGNDITFYENFQKKSENKNLIEFERIKNYYREYLEYGGFPQVALEEDFNQKKLMLRDIFNSYFQIDVLTLSSFNKLDAFKRLIFLLLERVGSKLDITKLASLSGVSRDSVYSYISLLQGSYFIYLVPKYSGNRDREISGAKKVYICDNGILNLLSKVSHGSLLENSVFMNLKHYGELKYYQRRSGLEIDFILNGSCAFEVKTTGAENDIKRLRKFAFNLKISDYYLISENFVGLPQTILAYQI